MKNNRDVTHLLNWNESVALDKWGLEERTEESKL